MLWNEKVFLVHDAMENQYFNSEWYEWCDKGYFRNSNTINQPNPNKIDKLIKNKIYYGVVCKIIVLNRIK